MNNALSLPQINASEYLDPWQVQSAVTAFEEAWGCEEFDVMARGGAKASITSQDGSASITAYETRMVSNANHGYRNWIWEDGDQANQRDLVALMNYLNGNNLSNL